MAVSWDCLLVIVTFLNVMSILVVYCDWDNMVSAALRKDDFSSSSSVFLIYVTGTKFGIRKRRCGSCVTIVIVNTSRDAGECADELWHFLCTCSVVFPRKVEQMIVMSFYDVTMISHAMGEGSI